MTLKPMLASPADLKKVNFPVLASPKIDGVRSLIVDNVAVSRALKPFPNKAIQGNFNAMNGEFDLLDGEFTYGPPNVNDVLSKTISMVMSEDKIPEFPITYWSFDTWLQDKEYTERAEIVRGRIERLLIQQENEFLVTPQIEWKFLESTLINNSDDLLAYELSYTEQGYEGIMIRDPRSIYKMGRSTTKEGALLKVKRFEDAEAVIYGWEEEMENTNEATKDNLGHTKRSSKKEGKVGKGMLGKWLVRGIKEFDGLEFKVAGFNDRDALEFWNRRDEYVGKIITYKYFPSGVKDLPRHPTFKGFRNSIDMSE